MKHSELKGRHSTKLKGRHSTKLKGRHSTATRSSKRPTRGLWRYVAALFVISALLFSTPDDGVLKSAAAADVPPASCPGGSSQCVTVSIPIPCGTSTCPAEVTVGPTTNVGSGEYVYLYMTGLPVGDSVRIAYCPITEPPQIVSGGDPMCAFGTDPEQVGLSPAIVPVAASGAVAASFPTQIDPSGEGNAPITASPLYPDSVNPVPFFCDSGPDYCGIEVEDLPGGNPATAETTSNTAIIPISFAPQSSGCPNSDPQVQSDSAFSLEHFLPAAVDGTCARDSGVADVNIATESGEVVQNFADGGVPLAFTDEAQDPEEATELGNTHYLYIPVAVSATVIGFVGEDSVSSGKGSPVASYNLTPNMIAGLITDNYSGSFDTDLLIPPLVCKRITGCYPSTEDEYGTFNLLNPVPTGVHGPENLGTFFSNTESGASYQVTDWLCNATNAPFTVTLPLKKDGGKETPVQVTDENTAAATLTNPIPGNPVWPPAGVSPTPPWPFPKCEAYSTLPVLAGQVNNYSFAETPALQVKAMRPYGEQINDYETDMGFGAMDWSEASYYGLESASLENAAGDFVAPSADSLDAALDEATMGPNGVLQYSYDDSSNPAAYPMPMVTYALVSTAHQAAASSQAEGDLLTNLVCYSHTGGSAGLPTGYVQLPDNLYDQARSEISKTFPYTETSCNGPTPALPVGSNHGSTGSKPTGQGSSHSSTSSTTAPLGGSRPSSGTGGKTGAGSVPISSIAGHSGRAPSAAARNSGQSSAVASTQPSKGPGKGFEPVILALAEGTERWIVAGLGGAALLGLIVGPLVVLAPRARRRLRTLRKAS